MPTRARLSSRPTAGQGREGEDTQLGLGNIKGRNTTKTVPGAAAGAVAGRQRLGSGLSARDVNARAGSRTSVSSQDGDRFYTAIKEEEKPSSEYHKSKIYRNSQKSYKDIFFKENIAPQILIGGGGDKSGSSPVLKESTYGSEVVPQSLKSEEIRHQSHDYQEIFASEDAMEAELPNGVLNILIDEGLYEYSREAYVYLKEMESYYTIPMDFLDTGCVTANMRMILVDWLIQVQYHLRLTQESLYLAISILDTVLHRRDVDPDKLQLVGVTALLVATKLEEYYPAEVGKLLHLTENSYTRTDVLNMERVLLQVLGFKAYIPSGQVFLLRYTRAALRSDDPEFYSTCTYILDTHLVLATHSCSPASHSAAAAVLLASLLYHVSAHAKCFQSEVTTPPTPEVIWTPTLAYFSNLSFRELLPLAMEMVNQMILSCSDDYKFRGAISKYGSNSQHKRLATLDHVQKGVLKMAKTILKGWSGHYS